VNTAEKQEDKEQLERDLKKDVDSRFQVQLEEDGAQYRAGWSEVVCGLVPLRVTRNISQVSQ